jgi:predicted nucleotidyltransferase
MNNYIEIYSVISGSKAYGTDNENSDTDLRCIAFPDFESMFGLDPFITRVVKDPDITIYSFNKFVSLALNANPNILELLWIEEPKNVLVETYYSKRLKQIRGEFLSKKAFTSYFGYAKAQLHKIKNEGNCSAEMNSKRKASIDLNGYDVKAAMHLMRLLYQLGAIEMEGCIPMPLTGHRLNMCLEIRNGKVPFDLFKEYAEAEFNYLETLEAGSKMRSEPDYKKIKSFVVEMNRLFYVERI